MSRIHIAVACHKPSVLPKNPLLVPVQVNSANARTRMDMSHDDDGENISSKNPSYCELTAQYWEWKNVDADYYGLCHYRRFLCFTVPENAKRDDRNHIVAETIDPYNISRFGLEDESTMRNVIESNDCIVGEYEDIKKLGTPLGKQPTTYKHWAAHDMALIRIQDLDRMLEILDEVSPSIGKDAREYLEKDVFTGFNCFILKKDLFDELCRVEFEVLERLEKEVDLTNYCLQLSRIFGFMGEIISSSYIYHLEKRGQYRVKHVPILYFNYTDEPSLPFLPAPDVIAHYGEPVNILLYRSFGPNELIGPMLQSLLDNVSESRLYNVIVLSRNLEPLVKEKLLDMVRGYKNIQLGFWDAQRLERMAIEQYFSALKPDKRPRRIPLLPFVPYFLTNLNRVLVFRDNVLICGSIDELWETELSPDELIASALDSLVLAQVNHFSPDKLHKSLARELRTPYEAQSASGKLLTFEYLSQELADPYAFYGTAAMLMDFSACRECLTPQQIASRYYNRYGKISKEEEAVNVVFEGRFHTIPQEWSVWLPSNAFVKELLPYAPRAVYQELQTAQKTPKIICYQTDDPWIAGTNLLIDRFWTYAKKTPFHDFCILFQPSFRNYTVLKYDFDEMQKSLSFRTGRMLTWLPRRVRDSIRRP